jgi:hypothetical protein
MGLGFELKALSYKAGTLPFEPHLQSILLWLFLEMGFINYLLSWLPLNHNPPDLSLLGLEV